MQDDRPQLIFNPTPPIVKRIIAERDLPVGVQSRAYAVPTPDDFVWDGALTKFAACETPHLIVEPAPGYEFRYQIMTDSYAIVKK